MRGGQHACRSGCGGRCMVLSKPTLGLGVSAGVKREVGLSPGLRARSEHCRLPFAGRFYSRYTRAPAGDFFVARQVLTCYRKETVVAEKIMHKECQGGFCAWSACCAVVCPLSCFEVLCLPVAVLICRGGKPFVGHW